MSKMEAPWWCKPDVRHRLVACRVPPMRLELPAKKAVTVTYAALQEHARCEEVADVLCVSGTFTTRGKRAEGETRQGALRGWHGSACRSPRACCRLATRWHPRARFGTRGRPDPCGFWQSSPLVVIPLAFTSAYIRGNREGNP